MPTFVSIEDLQQSLRDAGLASLASDMARTVRPDIMFRRRSVADDTLPIGVSKVGGNPDLPAGFEWPYRAPFDDAEAREVAVHRLVDDLASSLPGGDFADDIVRKKLGRLPFLRRSFPLAFVAQIDLAAMALEAGFDDRLPDSGVLGVFYDITDGFCGSPRVVWHDGSGADLARREAPRELVDYYEIYGSHEFDPDTPVWPQATHADILLPVSGLSVPEHWRDFYASGTSRGDALDEWFDAPAGVIAMDATDDGATDDGATDFGDHLGGWPSVIQHHPEIEIDGIDIEVPGETPWRHLLSLNVGECWANTRLMALDDRSDGQHYIFMHDEDLDNRRFERARAVHQMT